MFKWLKSLVAPREPPAPQVENEFESSSDTLRPVSVWQVVDRFLEDNPTPTPYLVHALADAGAADLLEPRELLTVCEKIQEHGYQFPLNGVLLAELHESELLSFLRWHISSGAAKESYENEARIRELIQQFRNTA